METGAEDHRGDDSEDSIEMKAAKSCFKKISKHIVTSHVKFDLISLKYAKDHFLFCNSAQRKVVLLYMHTSKEEFSNIFMNKLRNPEISDILCESFVFMGWDLDNKECHFSLKEALLEVELEHLCTLVDTQTCAVVILQNINERIKVVSCLIEESPDGVEDTFLLCLKNSRDFLIMQRRIEHRDDLSENNDIDAEKFQGIMADMLGDRDYDSFAFNQHSSLKDKIGFALFGQPMEENGYSDNQNEQIDKIFKSILKHNNLYAEHIDQVEISFIYNVMEPLPNEKKSRAKKYPNYNPKVDISPVPIFVLRKCKDSEDPCRIFIDEIGRVYDTWQLYIENNKLPECIMILPKNGRYEVQENRVILESHKSPACNTSKTILKTGDIVSTIGGVGSGVLLLGAGVASIPAIPAIAVGATVVGTISGLYSIAKNSFHLADRVKHDEDLNFKNSEARGIYFNILAGAVGFVGFGANALVSQLVSQGVNIGKGVGAVVNTVGVVNIGVSGASIINSSYDVYDQWFNRNHKPNLLTIVQLSSSILFFGNAVYNFKSCKTMIDESQAQVLQDYQESLRSNRHRKTFNKLMKETIRQNEGNQVKGRAEVIKTICNIPQKDEIFAALTRNNKLMNKKDIKFSASNGEISFNGKIVNINDFSALNKQQAEAFLSNLPTENTISSNQTTNFINNFSLNSLNLPNVEEFAQYSLHLIAAFGIDIQGMLVKTLKDVIGLTIEYFKDLLDELFPNRGAEHHLLNVVMEYFGGKAADYMKNYNLWCQTGSPYYYKEEYVDIPLQETERYIWIFSKIVKVFCNGGNVSKYDIMDIIKHVESWIFRKFYTNQRNEEENSQRAAHSPKRKATKCLKCDGRYFQ
ncbi:uncharacterized protein LOC130451540 isoform X1 [Diorhabda sublineata]|uniref:uncharacterized protein LOC130451540 isoform X1 n=1 Tax=Diorhabda sublineata TaxID=1163346 RepID=UPI0024E0A819|nr:uncharacterized protein LOC130451540 isoform X1 [Diorhabda sublineata]XP_056646598.1 uncharacterized protein LOC130451540 isoform X1 [Diorhabda sublineata]XP_056646599.1 uncharacterized protein LOC130451540 isoform X1 [Diorhabda sublineata]